MADQLPNLSHRRPPTTDRGFWQCECGTLIFGNDEPAGFICTAAVAAWGAEQRDTAAAKERAAVVAWLSRGSSWSELDAAADAIEAGEHLETTRA